MPHRTSRTLPLALAGAMLITLAACGDDPADSQRTTPGTELSFGDSALVTRSGDAGTMSVTVQGIEEGTPADLKPLDLPDVADQTPYFVQVEVTPRSGDTPIDISEYLNAFAGDQALTFLPVYTEFPRCQEEVISTKEGARAQQVCLVFLSDKTAPAPDAVAFDNDGEYAATESNAITWR